jgi:hypothetical protein
MRFSPIVDGPFHGLRKILQSNVRGRVRVVPLNFQKKKQGKKFSRVSARG